MTKHARRSAELEARSNAARCADPEAMERLIGFLNKGK